MNSENENQKPSESQIQMENQDLPNLPAATEKIEAENHVKEDIKKTSKLQNEGKTDNTEQNSEN